MSKADAVLPCRLPEASGYLPPARRPHSSPAAHILCPAAPAHTHTHTHTHTHAPAQTLASMGLFTTAHGRFGAAAVAVAAALPAAVEASAGSRAGQMRDSVPRYGGAKEFDPDNEDYQMGIAVLAAIPIVLAVLTLLACACFCLCRCCSCIGLCHKCVRRPREEGYSKRARFVPWLFLVLFGGLVFSMSTYGMTENDKLSDTLTAPAGQGSSFVNFIPRVFAGVDDKINELRDPVRGLLADLRPTVNGALGAMNRSVGVIDNGTAPFEAELDSYNSTWAFRTYTLPGGNFTCLYCLTISNQTASIKDELTNQTSTLVADLREVVSDVQSTLTDKVDEIEDKISEIDGTLSDAQKDVADASDSSDDIVKALNDFDPVRHQVTLIIYLVPLVGLALALVGSLLKMSCLFKANVWLYFLVGFVFWVLLAVYLPLAVVLGDACVYIDGEEAKLPSKTDDLSKVAQSCLDGSSIIVALDAQDQLEFSDAIEFPEFANATEAFEFDTVGSITREVSNLTLASFEWDDALITTEVDAFNTAEGTALASANYTEYDPANVFPGDTPAQNRLNASQTVVSDLLDAKTTLNNSLTALQADTQALADENAATSTRFADAISDMNQVEAVTAPLLLVADQLTEAAECSFVGSLYRELDGLVCSSIMGHMSVMAMTCFFIAFSAWWIIVFSQISASRVPRPYRDEFDDAEKGGEAAGAGTQVEMQKVHVRPSGEPLPPARGSARSH